MEYTLGPRGEHLERKLVPNPKRAKVVKQIYERYASGKYSLENIKQWLEENNHPTASDIRALNGKPHPRKKKGYAEWSRPAIRYLLINTVNKGIYTYGTDQVDKPEIYDYIPEKIEIKVPAIVDPKTWKKAVDRLEANKRVRRKSEDYALKGRIRCLTCGNTMRLKVQKSKAGKERAYYECLSKKTSTEQCTPKVRVRREHVDRAVAIKLLTVLQDPKEIEREYNLRVERAIENNDPLVDQLEDLRQEIAEKQRSLDVYVELYADGEINRQAYNKKASAARAKMERLQEELQQLEGMLAPMPEIDLEAMQSIFKNEIFWRLDELKDYVTARTVIKRGTRPKQAPIAGLDQLLLEIYEQFKVQVKTDRERAEINTEIGKFPFLFMAE